MPDDLSNGTKNELDYVSWKMSYLFEQLIQVQNVPMSIAGEMVARYFEGGVK